MDGAEGQGVHQVCGGGTPSRDNLAYWNGDIPWVSPKDMKSERIAGAEECITSEGLLNSSSSMVDAGRLLMVVRSGILKHTIPVAINDVPVALNQDMKALRFSEHLATSDFFLRWVQGLNDALLLAWAKQGATVESIEHTYLAETPVPLPTLAEQHVIATFLDCETAKIDTLIAEQKKLLALLAEKRLATISRAVTRGLNPNAPMKDSGTPWLGEVPAHWEVMRLKHVTPQITVGIVVEPSKYYVDEGVPALRSLNVKDGTVLSENLVFISTGSNDLLAKSKIFAGDIVVVRSGQTGAAAVVPDAFDGANCIDLIIIRRPQEGCEKFLCWFLASHAAVRQFEGGSEGAIQKHFNIGTAANFVVAWPEFKEQRDIASFLDAELAKLAKLEALARREIELLGDLRSTLISAAVTGKIDVRDVAREAQ